MNSPMVGFDTISLYKHPDGIWADGADEFHNRGFLFGDGLFETMVFVKGRIRFANHHNDRLVSGMRTLYLEENGLSELSEIEVLLNEIWGDKKSLRVRWNVYRAGLGKYTPETNTVIESLQIHSFQPAPKLKEKACFSQNIHIQKTPWSHCKTLSALPYVMANQERKSKGLDEVILTTPDGFISEAGASNLFWVRSGHYFTPSLETGCIAGVGRSKILDYLGENNIPFSEGLFKMEDLLKADQILTSNVTGISYLQSLENKNLDTHREKGLDSIFELN
ncbi:aminotransferase class IV [Cognataquiflexum rubidum]|uniref:aminotransferase class IV n=1 Tax=Cognataquiflexum rubidum TaxID=2922273 RepID=UPI001F14752A|nr:aminotransferase class IV [Cognataquiflexum rubidum]MCH6234305.1 aminotransferase class IV [Cognataquiflexum rubidum]